MLKINDKAPDFTLPSQGGKNISLKDFLGKKNLVVYFYPKDNTPGCTAEACSFRDEYEVFKEAGAEVIGISSDSEGSHSQFASMYKIPFILLSDKGGKVRRLFGVESTLGLLPGRVTFVIDKEGFIQHVFSSQFRAARHVQEALKIIKGLTR